MKKMNMYVAPNAEIIEMQTVAVLTESPGMNVDPVGSDSNEIP